VKILHVLGAIVVQCSAANTLYGFQRADVAHDEGGRLGPPRIMRVGF